MVCREPSSLALLNTLPTQVGDATSSRHRFTMTKHGSTVTRQWIWYCILPRRRLTKYFVTSVLNFGIVLLYVVLYFGFDLEAEGDDLAVVCTV